ncbi:unnamed protein product, partial [Rotaria magnacalcarata]
MSTATIRVFSSFLIYVFHSGFYGIFQLGTASPLPPPPPPPPPQPCYCRPCTHDTGT